MHQIRREKRTTISEVIKVRVKRAILWKIEISFISNFLLKVRVLYLTILKRKNVSLPLKVETDQFVIWLVLPECLYVKIRCISPSNSEANCDGADAGSPFKLFSSFSASFKNSSLREKVGNCLRLFFVLGLVGGVSVSIHYSREISEYFSPR